MAELLGVAYDVSRKPRRPHMAELLGVAYDVSRKARRSHMAELLGVAYDVSSGKVLNLLCVLQVEQLQDSMQSVMQCMSLFCQKGQASEAGGGVSGSTQTDIIAVHTPQMESGPSVPFPYQRAAPSTRPSSLPILQSRTPPAPRNPSAAEPDAPQELRQYATSLVDGVLRTVAEQGGETDAETDASSDQGEVNFSVKQNANEADCSREDMTEDVENGQEDREMNEGTENGHSASDEGSGQTAVDAEDTQKTVVSQDENHSCVKITTEPPSTPSSPFEQLDSPNNNHPPIERNAVQ
jgi:hypothetical protein